MLTRRETFRFALTAGAGALAASGGSRALAADATVTLPIGNGERPLVAYPGKRPLIRLTTRPPQLETPFGVFDEGPITPNDAFYVRYHLEKIPLSIDPDAYRLTVGGKVDSPLSLSLHDLRTGFEPVEVVAVNQCSGNGRGFFNPRVAGGQLGNGAMGCARWKGVPLKALLARAGVNPGVVQISFEGLDTALLMPPFVKALDIDHARDGEVMVAYAMNGEDLPWLNGFPARLVVPGFYGTYWMKHIARIDALDAPFDGYWVKSAYRIPANACACTEPGKAAASTVPIGRLNVRSFITNIQDGATVAADQSLLVRGIAFDGGHGIANVAVSADEGRSWGDAALGEDLGKYAFRPWTTRLTLPAGAHRLMVRATNAAGDTQPLEPLWNPSGYMRNVVESVNVRAS
ncbi:molybdopterin-dependent oxidoreductase [Roseiarcus fermentans]|nr:molybdopterin-dependent oxidoreductase [Roseiarcus fermentans]